MQKLNSGTRNANSDLNIPGGHQAIALSVDCCTVTRTSTCRFLAIVSGRPLQRRSCILARYVAGCLKSISLPSTRAVTVMIVWFLYQRAESYD